jgi:chaperonin cofactor prefoldin
MALGSDDVRRIVDYAKPWLRDAILEMAPHRPAEIDTQLLERIVRVEEELKVQRELMVARFDAIDERFAASDKRFEDMQTSMDKRFAAVDRRFEGMQASMDKRFEDMQTSMDKRFEDMQTSMDKRFQDMQTSMDKRFEEMRVYSDCRFASLQWTILVGLAVVTAAVTAFGLIA